MRDEDLHISAVTIGEIQSGIEITREQDADVLVESPAAKMVSASGLPTIPESSVYCSSWTGA